MVPYKRVGIVGSCLFFQPPPVPWRVNRKGADSILLPLLFLILVDLVRCGLRLSLVSGYCSFDSIPSVPVNYYGV
jgi:hypothetical protein